MTRGLLRRLASRRPTRSGFNQMMWLTYGVFGIGLVGSGVVAPLSPSGLPIVISIGLILVGMTLLTAAWLTLTGGESLSERKKGRHGPTASGRPTRRRNKDL